MCLSFFQAPAHDVDKSVVWIQKDNSGSVVVCLFVCFCFLPTALHCNFIVSVDCPLFSQNQTLILFLSVLTILLFQISHLTLEWSNFSSQRPRPSVEENERCRSVLWSSKRNIFHFASTPQTYTVLQYDWLVHLTVACSGREICNHSYMGRKILGPAELGYFRIQRTESRMRHRRNQTAELNCVCDASTAIP